LRKPAVETNLVFINTYDYRQSYTDQEHRGWYEKAGFENLEFKHEDLTIFTRNKTI